MSKLTLFLLGPPHVERDGKPVHIGRRKAVALLAYLAVESGRQSREALVTLLSPEFDASRARAELRRTLSVLNSLLGEGLMAADRETVALDPAIPLALDVHAFRRLLSACGTHDHSAGTVCTECVPFLADAVALYRDEFMAGFTLPDSRAFEEWQFFQAEALRDEVAGALARLVDWHIDRTVYPGAFPDGTAVRFESSQMWECTRACDGSPVEVQ
jgi:DNA-binding SARP family transcriptional activator